MGATAMPRTNVIVSLVCRSVLSQHESNGGPSAFGDQQLNPRHGGVLSHTSQNFTAADDMSMDPSAVMIGEYNPQCSFGEIESATAMITLWGNLVASALGAVTAPIWGKMSDRFGRIKPLAAMFFGMSAGPAFGGYLVTVGDEKRPLLVFYVALEMMRVVGILILVTCVPESLAEHRRWPKSLLDDLGPRKLLQGLAPSHLRSETRRNVIVLAAVNVIMFGASMGAMNVLMLYSEFVFGWGNMESGTFLSMVNFCRAVSTAAVLPYAVKFSRYFTPRYAPGKEDPEEPTLDTLDVFLLRVSIVSDVIGYIGYALAPTGPLFTTSGAVAALGAIGLATSEASMTKLVS
ncbi:hypothetical protein SLS57_011262 [Botryosphaeria dothidea]